eukprot:gb/GECH01014345.1/.p1 GENE.gb/GECH01014345.1/~~gb/GECH01014345.1/.p1  ORF type:complete len:443 (+),score=103.98 gb/GECH01014345.1/:1-1329(+)
MSSFQSKSAQRRLNVLSQHLNDNTNNHSISSENENNPQNESPVLNSFCYNKQLPPIDGDYLQFNDLITPEQQKMRLKVRNFMKKHIAPIVDEYTEKAEFPWHILPLLAQEGILAGTACGPANYSLMDANVIALEMSRIDNSLSTLFSIHGSIVMPCIGLLGTDEQKSRFIPKMSRLEKIGAFALTEPNVGSDASHIETTATLSPDGRHYVINGEKRWIGAGVHADVIIVWATNTETKQVNGFIVEKGTPGFTSSKIEHKAGLRSMENANLYFNDCKIPVENFLPGASDFKSGPSRILQMSRITVGWMAVGMGMGAYEAALQYTRNRKQFGRPVAKFQIVQEKLVRCLGTVQSTLLLAHRITQLFESNKMTAGQSALAKAHCTLRIREALSLAREVMGGNGIIYDFGVARHFMDMEAVYTFEGTYEINTLVTGREITGLSAFK